MTDIRKFSVFPTARLHLRDANDELMYADDDNAQPIAVNLYGPGSKQYAKAQALKNNRILDKLKRKGKTDQSAEEQTAETAQFLADCVASWENMEYEQRAGRELSIAVFSDQSIGFIADQVAKYISEWSNFTQKSTMN
jgi:hypothetical protein